MATTVIAYTSAAPSPIVSQVDKTYDLPGTTLPVTTLQLYGDAEDSADPTPTWTWKWSILYQPPGSTTSFVDDTVQNAVLQDIDIWGNTLLFMVATNTNTPVFSEKNPLAAPNTARVTVRITSDKADLEKMAAGERDWIPIYNAAVQVIEDLKAAGLAAHVILSHSDVNTATGPDVDRLVDGSYADQGGAPANAGMHKHQGKNIDLATDVLRGVATLEEPPLDPVNPKIITQERLKYTGSVDGTQSAAGYVAGGIFIPDYGGGDGSPLHLAWRVQDDCSVIGYTVTMQDGGPDVAAGEDAYEFELQKAAGKPTYESNTLATLAGTAVVDRPALNHGPMATEVSGLNLSLSRGEYFGLAVTEAPVSYGGGLTVVVDVLRKV